MSAIQKVNTYTRGFLNSQLFVHLLLIIANVSFAALYMISKYALTYFNPVHLTMYRSIICTLSIAPLWLIIDRNYVFDVRREAVSSMPKWKAFVFGKIPDLKTTLLLALSGLLVIPLNQIAFIFGLKYTDSLVAGVFQPSTVVFTAFISILLRNEAKSILKFVGIAISVVGAISMILVTGATNKSDKEKEEDTFVVFGVKFSINGVIGACFFIGNTLSYSVYINVQRVLLARKIPSFTVTFWSFLFGTILCVPITLFFINGMDYSDTGGKNIWLLWGCVFFAGIIGGAVPFVITTFASGRLSPIVVSTYSTTIPIFSAILSLIVVGHIASYWSIPCCTLIIIGVLMVGYAKYKENSQIVATPTTPTELQDIEISPTTEREQRLELLDDTTKEEETIDDSTKE
ncbi:hypothetical protein AKO1_012398 [Acrasis kona]|uniref:EamA domain-containing protein n=1 Tax=Acrasis kona TaxID=1008807 RepID=A0AAW2YXS5_9EUKA